MTFPWYIHTCPSYHASTFSLLFFFHSTPAHWTSKKKRTPLFYRSTWRKAIHIHNTCIIGLIKTTLICFLCAHIFHLIHRSKSTHTHTLEQKFYRDVRTYTKFPFAISKSHSTSHALNDNGRDSHCHQTSAEYISGKSQRVRMCVWILLYIQIDFSAKILIVFKV